MTAGTLTQLRHKRDALKQQADTLTVEMTAGKATRHALEKEDRGTKLEEVVASLHSMGERMHGLQRDLTICHGEINLSEARAHNLGERIREMRHELSTAQRRERNPVPVLYSSSTDGISAELKEYEDRYVALVGEQLPLDEA
jgi:chromosome segregation ATPase